MSGFATLIDRPEQDNVEGKRDTPSNPLACDQFV